MDTRSVVHLKPCAFKLWVNWIQLIQGPHRANFSQKRSLFVHVNLVVAVQVELKANFETRKSRFRFKG
jgi:hypothetical protein